MHFSYGNKLLCWALASIASRKIYGCIEHFNWDKGCTCESKLLDESILTRKYTSVSVLMLKCLRFELSGMTQPIKENFNESIGISREQFFSYFCKVSLLSIATAWSFIGRYKCYKHSTVASNSTFAGNSFTHFYRYKVCSYKY